MRIALLTYRGNMFCGGQGIYAAYLAREWKRAGHDVHVFAGPPVPELEGDIPLHVIPNDNVFGQSYPDFFDPKQPFSLLKPLSLWELGVSRSVGRALGCGLDPPVGVFRYCAAGAPLAKSGSGSPRTQTSAGWARPIEREPEEVAAELRSSSACVDFPAGADVPVQARVNENMHFLRLGIPTPFCPFGLCAVGGAIRRPSRHGAYASSSGDILCVAARHRQCPPMAPSTRQSSEHWS